MQKELAEIKKTLVSLVKTSSYYLSEGKTKKEAITCLARRLVDIIFAITRDRSIYNFSKSGSTKKHEPELDSVAA